MKQITFSQVCGMMDPVCLKQLLKQAATSRFLVVFENSQMDSSRLGSRTVMAVGPGKTYETLDSVKDLHLNDLPSMREYPVAYADMDDVERWAVEQMDSRDEAPKWEIYVIYDRQENAEHVCIDNNQNKPDCFSYQVRGLTTREYASHALN